METAIRSLSVKKTGEIPKKTEKQRRKHVRKKGAKKIDEEKTIR
jgi:hypothetical protein